MAPSGETPIIRLMAQRHADALEHSLNLVLLMTGVKVVDWLTPSWHLDALGIYPRALRGLPGILFSPLLHYNFAHLLSNIVPLGVLLALLYDNPRYRPAQALAAIWIASGFGTWLIGRGVVAGHPVVHIGASSLVFGLAAYLIVSGFLMRSWRELLIALLVLFAFGTMFVGVLPRQGPVSWEGHLCGAIAGVWTATRIH